MMQLDHVLERSVFICATRVTVFRFFTDSERFAEWWGPGSRIDARPGGAVLIRYPNGVIASGTVLEVVEPERIVFTYGYDQPDKPIPPGGSRVVITLREQPMGTLLELRHELADPTTRDHHVPGWRYQLALFANVAARHQHADLDRLVDRFFAAWSETDAGERRSALAAITTDDVAFRDPFAAVAGRDDLVDHIGASQLHMPGMRLVRDGVVRHCQGTALADWKAVGADGSPRGRGSNLFDLSADGRIARAVGLWSAE
jgi:uncharacterized protein YndB with AHSA1/START domain